MKENDGSHRLTFIDPLIDMNLKSSHRAHTFAKAHSLGWKPRGQRDMQDLIQSEMGGAPVFVEQKGAKSQVPHAAHEDADFPDSSNDPVVWRLDG